MINQLVFAYFAAVIIVSAVLVITRKNPVHSVMFMLLLFFHIAGVFVLLNAEFLAAVQLIVYAGAILILFLFVVILLSVEREAQAARANRFAQAASDTPLLQSGIVTVHVVETPGACKGFAFERRILPRHRRLQHGLEGERHALDDLDHKDHSQHFCHFVHLENPSYPVRESTVSNGVKNIAMP